MRQLLPFLLSLIGVLTDFFTTAVGLNLGFNETHLQYHPILAILIFWGCLILLTLTVPKKFGGISRTVIASASFLGAANNTLVILGILK